MNKFEFQFINSIEQIDHHTWDELFADEGPFLKHDFLSALESSGCVGRASGWAPMHIVVTQNSHIVALAPNYRKDHSYGEYMFDWGWAEAYERHGLPYYPKLVSAIPFTPVTGARFVVAQHVDAAELNTELFRWLEQQTKEQGMSGFQCLFSSEANCLAMSHYGWCRRTDVQFHWHNRNYRDFAEFLSGFQSRKRKSVAKERRRVVEQGIKITWLEGQQITDEIWSAFVRCYQTTYLKRSGHLGYLNADFFGILAAKMIDHLAMAVAYQGDRIIACALYFIGEDCLYGRYWGALKPADGLHFELCCYQGIEYCIKHRVSRFEAGAQGEHKLARGFEPVLVQGGCVIHNATFRGPIERFCREEALLNRRYLQQARQQLPFKQS